MKLTIQHVTHYDYSAPVEYALRAVGARSPRPCGFASTFAKPALSRYAPIR
jgi:hypothetical protein